MTQNTELHDQAGAANPTGKQPCADAETIAKNITRDLRRSNSFPKTIDVSVEGNEVRLTGSVLSLQDKKTAEATACIEPGATNVKNDINVP